MEATSSSSSSSIYGVDPALTTKKPCSLVASKVWQLLRCAIKDFNTAQTDHDISIVINGPNSVETIKTAVTIQKCLTQVKTLREEINKK